MLKFTQQSTISVRTCSQKTTVRRLAERNRIKKTSRTDDRSSPSTKRWRTCRRTINERKMYDCMHTWNVKQRTRMKREWKKVLRQSGRSDTKSTRTRLFDMWRITLGPDSKGTCEWRGWIRKHDDQEFRCKENENLRKVEGVAISHTYEIETKENKQPNVKLKRRREMPMRNAFEGET